MGKYNLVFRKSVAKDMHNLPKKDVARLLKRLESLTEDPRQVGCEKLTEQERYRIRQGNYRVVYEIRDKEIEVVVVKIGHRREEYRGS
jgi:mRNA interferase RelE/StbE